MFLQLGIMTDMHQKKFLYFCIKTVQIAEQNCSSHETFFQVAIYMSYIDKLSTRAVYGGYLDGQYTCKADYTPDALKSIKVVQPILWIVFKFLFHDYGNKVKSGLIFYFACCQNLWS